MVGITNSITLKLQVTPSEIKSKIDGHFGEARSWMLAVSESRSKRDGQTLWQCALLGRETGGRGGGVVTLWRAEGKQVAK